MLLQKLIVQLIFYANWFKIVSTLNGKSKKPIKIIRSGYYPIFKSYNLLV